MAIRRSEHLASIADSRAEPGPSGAPRRIISKGLIPVKPSMAPHTGFALER